MTAPDYRALPRSAGSAVLRRFHVEDRAAFHAYRCDATVGRYQDWSPMSASESLAFITAMAAATLFEPGKWAQGAEAMRLVFEQTGVARVIAVTDARNTASVRLLERVGLGRVESRETVFKAEPCTEWVYAKLR